MAHAATATERFLVAMAIIFLLPYLAWRQRRDTGTTAALGLGVPLVLGVLVGVGMLRFDGWIGPRGTPSQFVAGIGMACAGTALPILVLLLTRRREAQPTASAR